VYIKHLPPNNTEILVHAGLERSVLVGLHAITKFLNH